MNGKGPNVLWFRHGLRLHDNPALLNALAHGGQFMAVFIFDGQSAGTWIGLGQGHCSFCSDTRYLMESRVAFTFRHQTGRI